MTCVTMIAGSMIGSAIFSLSGLTIYQAGPSAILTWILAALIMMGYGLICAELSTRFPKSGGVFVFPSKALGKTTEQGKFWGWISTWGYINANIVAIAFAAIYVGTYLSVGFPVFANMQIPLAIISVVLISILNSVKFSIAGRANTTLVFGMVIAMVIYIVVAFGKRKIRIRSGELEAWMGYGRGIPEVLPPMVAAEKEGAAEPGSNGGTRVYRRIL